MEKKVVESGKGLSGMLKMFKTLMQGQGLEPATRVVFVGCAGTCTPFIELFAYTIRDLVKGMVFVPDGIVDDARAIWLVNGVGMQIGGAIDAGGADIVILLGGISMPQCTLGVEGANAVIARVRKPGGKVIGVCFMDMFAKAGWEGKVPFDLVLNADINPVTISKFE